MANSIFRMIYARLQQVLPGIDTMNADYVKLSAPGYMDLHVDVLRREGSRVVVSLRHSYVQNGDSMADPDMEVAIVPSMKMAEALTLQQDGVPRVGTVYQRVYPEPGKVDLRLKRELNQFLAQWLANIIQQGHKPVPEDGPAGGAEAAA